MRRNTTSLICCGIALICTACSGSKSSNRDDGDNGAGSGVEHGGVVAEAIAVGAGFTDALANGMSGGTVRAATLAPACSGTIGETPNHRLVVSVASDLRIGATPTAGQLADLTIAVEGADGAWHCADDVNELNPEVTAHFEPGTYRVYVGSYDDESRHAYALSVAPGSPDGSDSGNAGQREVPTGPTPTTTSNGVYSGLRIPAETGPATITGTAGGTREARSLSTECVGHIAMAPDHVFEIAAAQQLRVRVTSDSDTTLVMQGPDNIFLCNDDFEQLNPGLDAQFAAGTWNVYVGTYAMGQYPDYQLTVSR